MIDDRPGKSPVAQLRTAFAIAREVRTFLVRVQAALAGEVPAPRPSDWERSRPLD